MPPLASPEPTCPPEPPGSTGVEPPEAAPTTGVPPKPDAPPKLVDPMIQPPVPDAGLLPVVPLSGSESP
jgi:hypothetical protein